MPELAEADEINRAAAAIRAGDLVAMPTETVYGLAADATNDDAVAKIFEAKGRPRFNPLISHVTGREMAARFADIPPMAERLIEAFWPGPLTLVLPRRDDAEISLLASAGLDTIALRAPGHPMARALIAAADRPLAAPSANKSGEVSPTTAAHVREGGLLIDPAAILDGGASPIGVESTIIRIDGETATMLRPGGIARGEIEDVIGAPLLSQTHLDEADAEKPAAPGMLASHYAPGASVRLNADAPEHGEAFLGFGASANAEHTLNLSPAGDLREAAANLFAHLRKLDAICAENGLTGIAVAPIPTDGLGEAINDRLGRAAAPRG